MPYVTVHVNLDDFEDQDLLDEMATRNLDLTQMVGDDSPLNAIYQALKLGRDPLALELTRAMVCDLLGVIL